MDVKKKYITPRLLHAIVPNSTLICHNSLLDKQICHISIDSRNITIHNTFWALDGAATNGNLFIQDALLKGVNGIVCSKKFQDTITPFIDDQHWILLCDDTKDALITAATCWRMNFTIPIIGITGSVGKTTTKNLLKRIMEFNGQSVLAAHESQNSAIGVSLTLLRLSISHTACICEMGISQPGEMALLSSIVKPTHAAITNIIDCHIDGLKNKATIAEEKLHIINHFTKDSVLFINGESDELTKERYPYKTYMFGKGNYNDIVMKHTTGLQYEFIIDGQSYPFILPFLHEGIAYNACCAMSIATILNMDIYMSLNAIQQFVPEKGRFEIINTYNPTIIINDAYNANPESMHAGLIAFEHIAHNKKKILVLGDMLELGELTQDWHEKIALQVLKMKRLLFCLCIGKNTHQAFKKYSPQECLIYMNSLEDTITFLQKQLGNDVAIFIKASNGIKLHTIPSLMAKSTHVNNHE